MPGILFLLLFKVLHIASCTPCHMYMPDILYDYEQNRPKYLLVHARLMLVVETINQVTNKHTHK